MGLWVDKPGTGIETGKFLLGDEVQGVCDTLGALCCHVVLYGLPLGVLWLLPYPHGANLALTLVPCQLTRESTFLYNTELT